MKSMKQWPWDIILLVGLVMFMSAGIEAARRSSVEATAVAAEAKLAADEARGAALDAKRKAESFEKRMFESEWKLGADNVIRPIVKE